MLKSSSVLLFFVCGTIYKREVENESVDNKSDTELVTEYLKSRAKMSLRFEVNNNRSAKDEALELEKPNNVTHRSTVLFWWR